MFRAFLGFLEKERREGDEALVMLAQLSTI